MLAQFDLRLAPIRSESRRLLTSPIEDHDPAAFGHQAVSPEALAQVGEVLRTHKFSSLDRYLSVRSHPNQATNAIIPTFIIETNCQGRDTTVIGTVVDPVQNIFSCLPIEVMIEVIDRDWVADMATGPIRTTDLDAIQAWDRCCEDAVEFPRTQEQRGVVGWTSIGLSRRGTSDNRACRLPGSWNAGYHRQAQPAMIVKAGGDIVRRYQVIRSHMIPRRHSPSLVSFDTRHPD